MYFYVFHVLRGSSSRTDVSNFKMKQLLSWSCLYVYVTLSCRTSHALLTWQAALTGSADTAERAGLGDGVINVSALTTCSARLRPLFISHIPDSALQSIHWSQILLGVELLGGGPRCFGGRGWSQTNTVNLSITWGSACKDTIKHENQTELQKGPPATPVAEVCACVFAWERYFPRDDKTRSH